MTDRPMMTCDEVDGVLLDYLEETSSPALRASVDHHVASCVRCSALLRDLDSIRSQAERMPELAPSRDLWPGIAERIAPAVLPLSVPARPALPRRWMPLAAAAAAALVIGTAGITYVATSRSLSNSGGAPVAAPRSVAAVAPRASVAPETPAPRFPAGEEQGGPASVELSEPSSQSSVAGGQSNAASRGGRTSATLASRAAATNPSDIAYGEEIKRLQNIITQRRSELDPSTVSVIEESLKVIDAAVEQSRAALARDPKSGFLVDQLNSALDKKVELLRTVALLPSRT